MSPRCIIRPLLPAVAAALAVMAATGAVRADGEAGLVVQDGDVVRSYCIPFTGDGITGQQMLTAVGLTAGTFGGGSGLAVCSIGQRGCLDASSFATCFCQCQGGDCTYWAFFTRQYQKNWVYSSLAFNLVRAKDGDVHGWKWGTGGPNNAPAPQDLTFEQVCGHAPQGGAPGTPVATQPPPPSPTASGTTAAANTSPTDEPATSSPPVPAIGNPPASPSVTVTITRADAASPSASASSPAFELPPAAGDNSSDGSSNSGLIIFGAIAAIMVVAIGGAAVWKARRGH